MGLRYNYVCEIDANRYSTMTDTTTETTRDGAVRLDDSTKYRVLADERRREVLAILAEENGTVGLDTLVDELVSRHEQTDGTQQVKVSLHHTHLPMMDDAGVVDYEPETKRLAPAHVDLDRLLE